MHLLIVDDSPEDRLLYRRLLADEPGEAIHIDEAGTGAEAVALFAAKAPDCVLLDYHLPDMTGIEVLDALRAGRSDGAPAVVMITGQGNEAVAVEAMKRGVHDYLPKGRVTRPTLGWAIRGAMEGAALRREVEANRKKLVDSNRELERFACVVAHDLQSPLTTQIMCLNVVREMLGDRLEANALRFLNGAIDAAARMRGLIRATLDFSRVDGQQQPFVEVDAAGIVREVQKDLAALIREQHALVVAERLPVVRGHRMQLAQVFHNLVANAIKYRRLEPPVVKIGCERRGDEWSFRIADNGVGIAAEFQQEVFEPYKRLHSYDEIAGHGLGLAICKKIIHYHGGRIGLESKPGEGTVVWFTLPAECAATA